MIQGGDYYGRTVNLAARIAAHANPGQVLVTHNVAQATPPQHATFQQTTELQLKGFAHPIPVLEAHPT